MDEPLSNLDAKLRVQMRADIAALQSRLGITTVYVTHDQSEAMTLGHRVAVLKDGRLQQCDAPRTLYERPGEHVRRRLHRLAGDEPLRGAARRRTAPCRSAARAVRCPPPPREPAGTGSCSACGRSRSSSPPRGCRRASRSSRSSAPTRTSSASPSVTGEDVKLVARCDDRHVPERDARVHLRPRPDEAHVFNPETGERLAD